MVVIGLPLMSEMTGKEGWSTGEYLSIELYDNRGTAARSFTHE
jgi:hypothetical protein